MLQAWHRPRIKALLEAGVDLLACETLPAQVKIGLKGLIPSPLTDAFMEVPLDFTIEALALSIFFP